MTDIPLTNTIPSNQLTKNSANLSTKFNEESVLSQDGLYMDSQFDKKRQSLDELANISFNYDATLNTTNNTANNTMNLNTSNHLNQDGLEQNEEQDEELFDELAMLCSGQFRQGTQKKKLSQINTQINNQNQEQTKQDNNQKNKQDISKLIENNDLYAPDDDSEVYDSLMRRETVSKVEENVDDDVEEEEEDTKEEEIENEEDDDEDGTEEEDEEDEENEEDEEDVLDEEAELEISDEEAKHIKKSKKLEKLKKPLKKSSKIDGRDGFFEEEAALSGSEAESDENYEGESDEDNSILFSGDEDELPSDSELKEQLGRIYLKDKMDEDKKQLRIIKEIYLNEDDLGSKNARRKNFRWKHIDDNMSLRRRHSSDEEDDDDDEDEDEEDENDDKKSKTGGFFKSIANGDWRSVRHEREQFVHSKLKKKENLLSDEENEKNEKNSDNSNDEDDDDSNDFKLSGSGSLLGSSSSSSWNNHLLKKGQQLLKQSSVFKSLQTKRPLDDESNTNKINRSNQSTTSKSSITIEKTNKNDKKINESKNSNNISKFSFLNRDKSYLNRISNYVNKNLSNQTDKFSFKTGRVNNMVFTTIDASERESLNNNNNILNDENKSKNILNKNEIIKKSYAQTAGQDATNLTNSSDPKRAKYENKDTDSIFNHL